MTANTDALWPEDFTRQVTAELTGNILPFWMRHAVDPVHGGFYGALTNDLRIRDHALSAQVRDAALQLASAVHAEGLDDDGSVFYEANAQGLTDTNKAWWPQAEAMVGFYNAYQLSGQTHFAQAAHRCWAYIQEHLVDRTHGDWHKELRRDGTPDPTRFKAGPWDCPYHHARACFEMLARA